MKIIKRTRLIVGSNSNNVNLKGQSAAKPVHENNRKVQRLDDYGSEKA
jgi:hypothetical protein